MLTTLIHTVTGTIQNTWTTFVTHSEITIPGVILLVGAMAIVNRKTRVHN